MTETFWGLLVAGGLVSLVHGLLPNHWLPFVLIGRSQGWTAARMVGVLAAAAAAHTAVAGAIAMVTLLVGVALAEVIEPFAHTLPALILGGTGLFYIALDLRGGRHPHHHHRRGPSPRRPPGSCSAECRSEDSHTMHWMSSPCRCRQCTPHKRHPLHTD